VSITINLLPWRENAREKVRKDFLRNLVICFILSMISCMLAFYDVERRISKQVSRNGYLLTHVSLLDKKINQIKSISIQREQLDFRMEVIQSLQGYRPMVVHVFDQLVKTLPEGVYYTNLSRQQQMLTIVGLASVNGQVSSLMRRLDASPWLQGAELLSIVESDQQQPLKRFVLEVDVHQINNQPDEPDS
tara:strand:- start:1977 stop:2546 length:570 start_codon:yes stop_codon:yes gene_type:complete